jgi:N-acetylglutamate synthase-like GNAT family acetyltransferase
MTIQRITQVDPLWLPVADFAEKCSWDACARMAGFMREGIFSDWERIFVATNEGEIIGFCALIKPMGFPGKEYTPLIKWVFVDENHRGKHISQMLIEEVVNYAAALGFEKVYLTTWHLGLYEKFGFIKMCDKEVREGYSESVFSKETGAQI